MSSCCRLSCAHSSTSVTPSPRYSVSGSDARVQGASTTRPWLARRVRTSDWRKPGIEPGIQTVLCIFKLSKATVKQYLHTPKSSLVEEHDEVLVARLRGIDVHMVAQVVVVAVGHSVIEKS